MEAVSSLTELERLLKNSSAMESEDMKELVKGLRVAVEDEEQRREVLEKKGEDAQHWLDVLQLLADSPDTSSPLRSTILTIMVRLSKNSGHFPKCLVIKNVKKQGEHPVGGGGFGDVWKGTIDHAGSTQTVCLKVVKVYLTSDVRQSLAADPSLRPSAPTILRELKPTVGTPIDPALLTLHSPPNPDILQSSSTPVPILRPSASTILHDLDVAVAKPAGTSLAREESVLAEPYQSNSQGDLSSRRSAATSRAARHQSPSPQRGIPLPASPHHPPRSSPPHIPKILIPWLATSISESSSRTSPPPPSPSDLVSATSSDSDDLGDGHWQKLPTHMANRRYLKSSPARLTAFKWVRGELIGKGTFGRVYLALNTTTGEMMAVKQVELPQTWNDRSRAVVGASRSESETLTDLDHPNIVQYLGFEETPTNLNTFLEYVPGGSVGSILLKHGKLSEPVTISFSAQILTGLEYLHSKGILHRDLKASNILVGMDGVCKISDFRQSKRTTKHRRAHTAMWGSSFWMAPEVLSPPKNGYDCKVDIWSLGCMILEMLTGTRPWSGVTNIPVMITVSRDRTPPPVPEGVVLSELADDFLRRKCFAGDPDERPTAAELRRHKYLELPPDWKFSGFP
ncbi:mitogen-activated protein kinase kinase kinase [Marasmius tenuissimus]|uniref:Mitogen-activated protein kinase kinase kinase n=1 Tax=Marasmius tenuissimus TaxID=585030 RepID=A0ABR2ZF89_9AGAR